MPNAALDTLHRRQLLGLALALASAGPAVAQASAPRAAPLRSVGLFSLLGDTIQIVQAPAPTDTRIERSERQTLDIRDVGLDTVALRALTGGLGRLQPQAQLQMFRATAPIALAEQRAIADGAHRAELPGWIVELLTRHRFSHVLLLTRHRGPAQMRLADGNTLGRGTVEGIGFYLDPLYEIRHLESGVTVRGALCAYVVLRLTLMDVPSGQVLAELPVRDGAVYGARSVEQSTEPWDILSPREKVEVLRRMLEDNLTRALPRALQQAGLS